MAPFTQLHVPPPPSHQSVVVRSLPSVTVEEREAILKDVEYNIFNFPAGLLTVDFLTDSGTSAMTDVQWAACKKSPALTSSLPTIFLGYSIRLLGLTANTHFGSNERR